MVRHPNPELKAELDKYRQETNTIFYSLSKNLVTLAVLSLTVSPAFIPKITNDTAKLLYVVALSTALISVFSGMAQYYRDWHVFKEYVSYVEVITYHKEADWTKKQKKLVKKFTNNYHENATFNTGHKWLILQLVAVLASLALLLSAIVLISLQ